MKRKMIPINEETHALLKEYCAERGLKMNYVVENYIKIICKKPTKVLAAQRIS